MSETEYLHPHWIKLLDGADHWRRLDAALAWEALARSLEVDESTQGNASVAWMHAAINYRAYSDAWHRAGGAARWDPDYQDEGMFAQQRSEELRGRNYGLLEPFWLNELIAGWPEKARDASLAELAAGGEAGETVRAARRVLAIFCVLAGEEKAGLMLNPEIRKR